MLSKVDSLLDLSSCFIHLTLSKLMTVIFAKMLNYSSLFFFFFTLPENKYVLPASSVVMASSLVSLHFGTL